MTQTGIRGVPPGRAGRVWLRRRLTAARRGRDQLDRKLRILLSERRRLRVLLDGQRHDWSDAWRQAQTWLLRAALLGGEDSIRVAGARERPSASIQWETVMGVLYPVSISVQRGGDEPDRVWGNAALAPAQLALWRAVETGGRVAVTEEAIRRLEAEISLTRRRLRALDQRWLPRLGDALHDLELTLEQAEQEEGIRVRHFGDAGWRSP